jgi:hypothetical protein
LALTQYLAIFLYELCQISYSTFYKAVLEFARNNPQSLLGEQYRLVDGTIERALAGGKWDVVLSKFGDVVWPTEEATFLNCVTQLERLYWELRIVVEKLIVDSKGDLGFMTMAALAELFIYQNAMVKSPYDKEDFSIEYRFNFHELLSGVYVGSKVPLRSGKFKLDIRVGDVYPNDLLGYAQKVVWYGRKGGIIRRLSVKEQEVP